MTTTHSDRKALARILRADALSTNIHEYQKHRMLEAANLIESLLAENEELRKGALPPVAASRDEQDA